MSFTDNIQKSNITLLNGFAIEVLPSKNFETKFAFDIFILEIYMICTKI